MTNEEHLSSLVPHIFKSQFDDKASLPTTSPWNLSPASQSTSKRKKAPRH